MSRLRPAVLDAIGSHRYTSFVMELLPLALIVVTGILALIFILKFIGGCLLRIILIGAIVALAVFLAYRFVWG